MDDIIPLEFNSACGKYGVDSLSFAVRQNERVGVSAGNEKRAAEIIGLALGQARATGGKITLFGEDTDKFRDRNRISAVLTKSSFPPLLSLPEVTAFLRSAYDAFDGVRFASLVKAFGLPESFTVGKLPPEQRFLLSTAAALSHKAELVVVGNVSHLDGDTASAALSAVSAEGVATLMVGSDPINLRRYAEVIVDA